MGQQVIYDNLTLDQFLRLPEAKPALEYIDGKVVQKMAPRRRHSILDTLLSANLLAFARPRKLGLPYVELRCTFAGRSIVSDLCFIAKGRIPKNEHGEPVEDVFLAPDLIVEIISPGQTVQKMLQRLTWCVRNGVHLGWLVQPNQRRVFIVRPGRDREVLEGTAVLSGEDVLPGYELPLAELFGWLVED